MGTKSKFFRAFVEGQTISDGRVIDASWIDQIVATFNTETYAPRINVEHVSGYSPEPPFNGYGTVVAVRAQTDDFTIANKAEKRRALYCQVDGNDQLVALVANDQKPFPSVELTESYAGTGKVGLIGLAFSDKPASIGTQALSFSRNAPGTVFATGADAVAIEFESRPADPVGIADAIKAGFASVAGMFSRSEPEKPRDPPPANDNFDAGKFATAIGEQVASAIAGAVTPLNKSVSEMQAEFATIKGKLEATEQPGFSRPPASGGDNGALATDC